MRGIESRLNRFLALSFITAAGGLGLAGCEITPHDPAARPEVKGALAKALRPEAVKIARIIFKGYQEHGQQYFYSDDSSVPGGEEITIDYRDGNYEYTLTADMFADRKGNLEPATTYRATLEGAQCHDSSCGDPNWTLTFANTDTFYSNRTDHTEHRKVWYGQEELDALWDTSRVIKEDDTHLKDPSAKLDSSGIKKALAEAEYLKRQADIALKAALLSPAYGYGQVGSPTKETRPATAPDITPTAPTEEQPDGVNV